MRSSNGVYDAPRRKDFDVFHVLIFLLENNAKSNVALWIMMGADDKLAGGDEPQLKTNTTFVSVQKDSDDGSVSSYGRLDEDTDLVSEVSSLSPNPILAPSSLPGAAPLNDSGSDREGDTTMKNAAGYGETLMDDARFEEEVEGEWMLLTKDEVADPVNASSGLRKRVLGNSLVKADPLQQTYTTSPSEPILSSYETDPASFSSSVTTIQHQSQSKQTLSPPPSPKQQDDTLPTKVPTLIGTFPVNRSLTPTAEEAAAVTSTSIFSLLTRGPILSKASGQLDQPEEQMNQASLASTSATELLKTEATSSSTELPPESSSSSSTSASAHQPHEEKVCRICYGGQGEDEVTQGRLISPCRCKGTMKYVHIGIYDEQLNDTYIY
jgi:hypothetical protein